MPAALQQGYLRVAPHPDALPTFFRKTVAMMMAFKDIDPAALRAIASPTLIMVGDSDVVLPEHAIAMSRVLPHAEVAVFPGATHGAYLGAAEAGAVKDGQAMQARTVAVVDEFLAR